VNLQFFLNGYWQTGGPFDTNSVGCITLPIPSGNSVRFQVYYSPRPYWICTGTSPYYAKVYAGYSYYLGQTIVNCVQRGY
jgi:hypothetical protein